MAESLKKPSEIFSQYEDFKQAYKDTHGECRTQGLAFTPLIIEAHGGGWSASVRHVVDWMACHGATTHQGRRVPEVCSAHLMLPSAGERAGYPPPSGRHGRPRTSVRVASGWPRAGALVLWMKGIVEKLDTGSAFSSGIM